MADDSILLEVNVNNVKAIKSIAELKAQLKSTNKEFEAADIGSDTYKNLEAQAKLLKAEIKLLTDATKANSNAFGGINDSAKFAAGSYGELKQKIKEAKSALDDSVSGTEVEKNAIKDLVELQARRIEIEKQIPSLLEQRIKDGIDESEVLKKQGKALFELGRAGEGAVTILGSLGGVFGLSKEEAEGLANSLRNTVENLKGVKEITKAITKENLSLATSLLTHKEAQEGVTVATEESAVASQTFGKVTKIALISTGIGAFLVLLGLIAANWETVKQAVIKFAKPVTELIEGIVGKLRDLGSFLTGGLIDDAATAKTKDNAEENLKAFEKVKAAKELDIKVLESQKGKEREVFEAKRSLLIQEIDLLKQKQKVNGELSDEESKKLSELRSERDVNFNKEKDRLKEEAKAFSEKEETKRKEQSKTEEERIKIAQKFAADSVKAAEDFIKANEEAIKKELELNKQRGDKNKQIALDEAISKAQLHATEAKTIEEEGKAKEESIKAESAKRLQAIADKKQADLDAEKVINDEKLKNIDAQFERSKSGNGTGVSTQADEVAAQAVKDAALQQEKINHELALKAIDDGSNSEKIAATAATEQAIRDEVEATRKKQFESSAQSIAAFGQMGASLQTLGAAFGKNSAAQLAGIKISQAATAASAIQATVEQVLAVSKAAAVPFPGNIPAILTTLSTVFSAIAAVKSFAEPFAEGGFTDSFKGGGHVKGPRLGLIGEAGAEFVVNNKTMTDPRMSGIVHGLDQFQKTGVSPFADGGFTASVVSAPVQSENTFAETILEGIKGMPKPIVTIEDINLGQERVTEVESRANL